MPKWVVCTKDAAGISHVVKFAPLDSFWDTGCNGVWMGSDAMEWHGMAWDGTEGAVVKCQASSFNQACEDREDCKDGWGGRWMADD